MDEMNILRKRAELLANEESVRASEEDALQMVEFQLANERYGIASLFVQEIYPLRDITAIPHTPPFVAGIVNVRGKIISVMDIKTFLNLPQQGITDLNKIIVLSNMKKELGILADAIVGVRRVSKKEILASPLSMEGIGSAYIVGLLDDGLIFLDARKILNDRRIIIDDGNDE